MRVLGVNHEHRQVVVALEVRARRLHHVEVRETSRGGPGCLLPHLEPAVDPLGAGRDRVPEVAAGLGVRVRQRPDLARVQGSDVLVDQCRRGAQHDRIDGAHVHHVAHRRRGAAIACNRLAHHREGDMVLAQAAVFLRDGQGEEAVLAKQLEVPARELQLVVGSLGIVPHLLLAQVDQLRAQLLVPVGQHPVRVPVIAKSPERLGTPHLFLAQDGPLTSLVGRNHHPPGRRGRARPGRRRGWVNGHDSPTISPCSSRSMWAAAGFFDRPGMVRISPQIG